MSIEELANINKLFKEIVLEYIESKGITINKFAYATQVQANQLWCYLNTDDQKKGLHTYTMEKIAKYIKENP
jgi:hypothetical protein